MKRIAIGGFFHESNTFNPIITDERDFIVFHKDEIFENQDSYLMAKGIIQYFNENTDKKNYKILSTIFAKAVPNGVISIEYYTYLKECFFRYLKSYGEIDAIVLALHGSMRIQEIGDAEGDILTDLRKLYPDTPIVCALDMHATITKKMIDNANAYVGFKTAPHIDVLETGYKAAEITHKCLEENLDLQMGITHLPIMIAGEKSETDVEPMKSLINYLRTFENENNNNNEILAASYLLGFPWADTKENGVTSLVVTKNDKKKAKEVAKVLAETFNKKKNEFNFSVESFEPKKAIEIALKQQEKLTFLSDSGDNPTAGSTGDNTSMLTELLDNNKNKIIELKKDILVAGIYDSEAVKICLEKPDKDQITVSVGGKFDKTNCKSVKLTGFVKKYIKSWGVFRSDIVLFSTEIFDLILVSKHIGFTSTDMFEALEIDYLKKDIIVVKLGYLTSDFKNISKKSILVLSKGCTNEVLSELSYSNKDKFEFV